MNNGNIPELSRVLIKTACIIKPDIPIRIQADTRYEIFDGFRILYYASNRRMCFAGTVETDFLPAIRRFLYLQNLTLTPVVNNRISFFVDSSSPGTLIRIIKRVYWHRKLYTHRNRLSDTMRRLLRLD